MTTHTCPACGNILLGGKCPAMLTQNNRSSWTRRMKAARLYKCREKAEGCHGDYVKIVSFQTTCRNPLCGLKKAQRDRAKREAKARAKRVSETREYKEKAKTRTEWLSDAQNAFNKFIRARDKDKPCISCGRYVAGQYCAGHFYTRKARPDLRFNEDNVHKQCNFHCNNNLSGNIENYRPSLIEKIGQERFDALQVVGRSNWSIDEIKEIKRRYAAMALELEREA